MQSRQTLFFLVVAAAALFQSSFAAPANTPSEVSQDSQALSQAPGANFVAVGATGKDQLGKVADTQSVVPQAQDKTAKDQPQEADADSSVKGKPTEQVGNPQQLVDTVNSPDQAGHRKRAEASDEAAVILKVKPDMNLDVAHEQGDAGTKGSSAEEGPKTDKLSVAKSTAKSPSEQDGKVSVANESKDEHSTTGTGDVQEHEEHKETNHMKARSEEPQDTPTQEIKILADHSTPASGSGNIQKDDSKSAAHATDDKQKDESKSEAHGTEEKQKDESKSTIEDKQDARPKEEPKALIETPTHAAESEEKKDSADKKVTMDALSQSQDLHVNQGEAFEHH